MVGWAEYGQIEPTDLQTRLENGEPFIILDVRHQEEYEFVGHIPQAQLMPLDTLAESAPTLPHDTPIVCVDRSGRRGQLACEQLVEQGFSQVFNLTGGMKAWRKAKLPTTR